MVGGESEVVHHAAVEDDPQRRLPDMGPAKRVLAGGANCRSEVSLPNPTFWAFTIKREILGHKQR